MMTLFFCLFIDMYKIAQLPISKGLYIVFIFILKKKNGYYCILNQINFQKLVIMCVCI